MDNRVWYTRWHDARLTIWTHSEGVGTVHPLVEQRLLRFPVSRVLVAAPQDVDRYRGRKLLREVAARFGSLGALVAHDGHLTTKPVRPMGVDENMRKRL